MRACGGGRTRLVIFVFFVAKALRVVCGSRGISLTCEKCHTRSKAFARFLRADRTFGLAQPLPPLKTRVNCPSSGKVDRSREWGRWYRRRHEVWIETDCLECRGHGCRVGDGR